MEDVLETYEKPYNPQEPESRAWNRRMNRDRIKIDWKFDRRAARRKFGHKKNSFKRSENLGSGTSPPVRPTDGRDRGPACPGLNAGLVDGPVS
jgi:hypothetical protein